jgi:ATP-dependent Lon protease
METDLEQQGMDNAQDIDEAQGIAESDSDGAIPEGADEGAEDGQQDADEDSGEEAAIAQAAAESQVKGQSRAQERIRRQQEELQRERQRAEAAERERQQLMQQLEAQRQAQQQIQQQQYLETLDPSERQAFLLQQQIEQMRREMQQQQFAQGDMTDKLAFQQRALENPMVAKYVNRVEETLANMRSKGQTAPRESILKFLIGEEVLNKAPAAVAKAARTSVKSVSKPLRARGNAAPSGRDEDADLEERLSKMTF